MRVERLEPWLLGGIQKVQYGNSQPAGPAGHEEQVADRLEISPLARELQLYRAHLSELSEIRLEKVEEIRQRLAEGSFSIDAHKVAAGMIKEWRLDARA